jgi:RNA polymerase sigma-70 factor, ECF subfamily
MGTYSQEKWDEWMRAALAGDAAAYGSLLVDITPWLKSYFSRRLRGADTDDLVQMTLLSVHTKRHTFDAEQPFLPWLCAVARHKLIDHVRKYKRHVTIEIDDNLADATTLHDLPPSLADRDLAALMKHLSPEQAEVLRLHKLKELSVEEVSRLTGHSTSNVKVMVHRALNRLKAIVGQKGSGEGGA